ncbi:MAG TPA: DNA methyltransferase, partial [Phycisphaerae bacterium]|nr:DNA methyltransferase [Phycisphaerae bacterium]
MDETRKQRFADFVAWTSAQITGDEKGQAQIFLDRLFQAFGQRGLLEVGGKPEFRIRKGREAGGGTAFADYVWKPVVLIEMKKRGVDLARHYRQAFDYWVRLAPGRPHYVVLCNFDEFWIYDFDEQMDEPLDKLALTELPEHWGPLAFLFPTEESPRFRVDRFAVTRKAADLLAECFRKLADRRNVGRETAQRFILQMLIALFSEDIGLLPKYFVLDLLKECTDPPKSFDLLGDLFRAMATPGGTRGGRYKQVPYFNGGIFAKPAPVELDEGELAQLRHAAEENWAHVSPDIFGTIFQHSMDEKERHAYGGHYTTQLDIMKIVGPTIVEPWRNLIENASTLAELHRLRERIGRYTVLDPACGSGNFLYIAYRELKRLEVRLIERIRDKSPRDAAQTFIGHLTSKQFFGIDIIPFAVELAKVTMTLAHKLAIDELHVAEKALPLDNLDANIRCLDALIDDQGKPTVWPQTDVIIGNPPFLGAKRLKPDRGVDYVNAVRKLYPEVPGMADYCVHWLRRAHECLPVCTPQDPVAGRAGLVGTQNVRNNQSRVGGLDYIVKSGVIVEAVDNQPWSGEANVHVSIVNWVKHRSPALSEPESPATDSAPAAVAPPTPALDSAALLIPEKKKLWSKVAFTEPLFQHRAADHRHTTITGQRGQTRKDKSFELAYRECTHINSALSDEVDVSGATVLPCNGGFCYTGQYPRYEGFMLDTVEAREMLKKDSRNRQVVWPFLVGREILTLDKPERWVIDFQTRSIVDSQAYAAPFAHLKGIVLPYVKAKAETERKKTGKDTGQDQNWLQTWWLHFRARPELIDKISKISRFIVCSRVTKRPIFIFVSPTIRPGDALSCFAFADDYSFGILQSDAHWHWFIAKCSKLKSDFRYTPESVFDTFPWPQSPTKKQIDTVADAAREIRRVRADALKNVSGGLRALYRTLELPGKNLLRDAHQALDATVLAAYGFKADSNILAELLALNQTVAARLDRNDPVTAPGIPPDYPAPATLVTAD